MSVVITVPALEVLTISNFPSEVLTSQVHPEPKFVTALVEKASLKSEKLQKLLFISSAISHFASPQAFGAKQFQ